MATPTGSSAWSYSSLSGDTNVDSLISGTQWANTSATYSFPTFGSYWSTDSSTGYGASSGTGEPWNDFDVLSSSDMVAVRQAFKSWAAVAQISFYEVVESQTSVGDIRLAYSSSVTQQAHAYHPASTPKAGDVWINGNGTSATNEWTSGTHYYMTAIHELGHAIGLKHPFAGSSQNSTISSVAWDTRSFTIMSYSARAGDSSTHFSYEPTTPMLLDILAVQHLYGANYGWKAGNDVYKFDGSSSYHQTIWDGGGNDTITYIANFGGTIDLREGHASTLGTPIDIVSNLGTVLNSVKNIWIAYGAVIENATGGSGNDEITGNAVSNTLNGGGGADTMIGGAGNDTYYVDSLGDRVHETTTAGGTANAGGTDTIISAVSFNLAASTGVSFVENLTLSGTAAINGWGNSLHNALKGNSAENALSGGGGNDRLNGGAGADTMIGGAGNDTYYVDNAADKVHETTTVGGTANAGGTDTIISAVSFNLAASTGVLFVENLTLSGTAAINGSGNALANTLGGNTSANLLRGANGNDVLIGANGADTLYGDANNDLLRGGAGNDILYGGLGNDYFRFDTALSTSTAMNVDRIKDFNPSQDTIQLENSMFTKFGTSTKGAINSAYFKANTTGLAQDSNDYIVYETDTGRLYYDSNGSAAGGSILVALLQTNLALTSADYVLV